MWKSVIYTTGYRDQSWRPKDVKSERKENRRTELETGKHGTEKMDGKENCC